MSKNLKASIFSQPIQVRDYAQEEREGGKPATGSPFSPDSQAVPLGSKKPDIGKTGTSFNSGGGYSNRGARGSLKEKTTSNLKSGGLPRGPPMRNTSSHLPSNQPDDIRISKQQNSAQRLHSARSNSKNKFSSHYNKQPTAPVPGSSASQKKGALLGSNLKNENLPPLNNQQRTSVQYPQNQSAHGPSQASQVLQKKIDSQVESGLVKVLENKYQSVAQKLDKAELQAQRFQFQNEVMAKDNQVLKAQVEELKVLMSKQQSESSSQNGEITRYRDYLVPQLKDESDKLRKQLEVTKAQNREHNAHLESMKGKFQEAEKMWDNLQGEGQRVHVELSSVREREAQKEKQIQNLNSVISTLENELQDMRKKAEKPRSSMSNRKGSVSAQQQQQQAKLPISPESNSGAHAEDVKMLFDQNEELRLHIKELEAKLSSKQKDEFTEATFRQQPSAEKTMSKTASVMTNDKLGDGKPPPTDVVSLKKRLKKEEELRKNFAELAKKREDELKIARHEATAAKEEVEQMKEILNKLKTVAIQRKDNKISVLEAKVKELNEVVATLKMANRQAQQAAEKKEKMRSKPIFASSAKKSKSVKFSESVDDLEQSQSREEDPQPMKPPRKPAPMKEAKKPVAKNERMASRSPTKSPSPQKKESPVKAAKMEEDELDPNFDHRLPDESDSSDSDDDISRMRSQQTTSGKKKFIGGGQIQAIEEDEEEEELVQVQSSTQAQHQEQKEEQEKRRPPRPIGQVVSAEAAMARAKAEQIEAAKQAEIRALEEKYGINDEEESSDEGEHRGLFGREFNDEDFEAILKKK